jgi:hypothetical protein
MEPSMAGFAGVGVAPLSYKKRLARFYCEG